MRKEVQNKIQLQTFKNLASLLFFRLAMKYLHSSSKTAETTLPSESYHFVRVEKGHEIGPLLTHLVPFPAPLQVYAVGCGIG